MGTNLGKLLADAGVRGGKNTPAPLTLAEAKAMSRNHKPETETFSKEAAQRLGTPFAGLKDPEKIRRVNDFTSELTSIAYKIENNRIEGEPVTIHTLIGICQLAHEHRDRVGPSRKKGFNKIIPVLLRIRDSVQSSPPRNIGEFIRSQLTQNV